MGAAASDGAENAPFGPVTRPAMGRSVDRRVGSLVPIRIARHVTWTPSVRPNASIDRHRARSFGLGRRGGGGVGAAASDGAENAPFGPVTRPARGGRWTDVLVHLYLYGSRGM